MLKRAPIRTLTAGVLGASFASPDTITEGCDHGRTSGATSAHETLVEILRPIQLTEVLLDVLNAASVALTIDGVLVATVVCGATSEDNAFVPAGTLTLLPGLHSFRFDYSPANTIYTSTAAKFLGTMWADNGRSYYDGSLAAYVPAFKLTAQVGNMAALT